MVRGQQSPPSWTRTVTGEAGENGQSSGAVSDRRTRIRPSVASGEVGTLYQIGRSLSTGSPVGRVAYGSETSRGHRARLDVQSGRSKPGSITADGELRSSWTVRVKSSILGTRGGALVNRPIHGKVVKPGLRHWDCHPSGGRRRQVFSSRIYCLV